jgi:hypothetical protein
VESVFTAPSAIEAIDEIGTARADFAVDDQIATT